jgi:proline dehydrogenase
MAVNISAWFERLIAGRWVAGYYQDDALERTRLFNSKHISTIINFLGEEITDRKKVSETIATYTSLVKAIESNGLDAAISVKPTQMGLCISYRLMLENYLKITRLAKEAGVFVWLDMEAPQYVDDTIKAYKRAVKYGNAGICIQAYMRRSAKDIEGLLKVNARIRLVKGAYSIDNDAGFGSHRGVSHNYMELMDVLFRKSNNFTLATHDSLIIETAVKMSKRYKRGVSYAMLNGIRNSYAKYLAGHGQKVAVYVPFGREWIGYGYRRLREQGHLSLIIRSLLERQDI